MDRQMALLGCFSSTLATDSETAYTYARDMYLLAVGEGDEA